MIVERIEIPEYDPSAGLKLPVDFDSLIYSANGEGFVIRANVSGLRLLAAQILTLAQEGVPPGTHLHFDPDAALEGGSAPFVVERINAEL